MSDKPQVILWHTNDGSIRVFRASTQAELETSALTILGAYVDADLMDPRVKNSQSGTTGLLTTTSRPDMTLDEAKSLKLPDSIYAILSQQWDWYEASLKAHDEECKWYDNIVQVMQTKDGAKAWTLLNGDLANNVCIDLLNLE